MTAVSNLSSPAFPLSPFVLGRGGQQQLNQRVPSTPVISPVSASRVQTLRESPVVPEIPSPLLRKLLTPQNKVQSPHKRGASSPLVNTRRAKKPSSANPDILLVVPNCVKHVNTSAQVVTTPLTPKSQEQVVPDYSPVLNDYSANGCYSLPTPSLSLKEGATVKPLDLFTDTSDIFATREE